MLGVKSLTSGMRRLIRLGAMGGLLLSWSSSAQAADEVTIEATDLGSGLYMLVGQGGNIGLSIGEDGVFLIDDQYAPLSEAILAKIKELGGGDVVYLLNTHWHGDHTGGNENFAKLGAVIVANKNVRERMSVEQVSQLMNRTTPASPDAALPVISYVGSVDFYFNGHKIEALTVEPSHTDGDSIVFIEEANVLHMGDTFFHTWYPFVDVDSGGDLWGMIAVHEEALDMINDDTKIIPGHGPLATKADLQASRDKLLAVAEVLQALIDEGKSDDEILAANPLAALNLEWGGFLTEEQFIRISLISLRSEE